MINREDLVKNDNSVVSVISLEAYGNGEWHYHNEITEYVICIEGSLILEVKSISSPFMLEPGVLHKIEPQEIHRVVNGSNDLGKYLMIQNGKYDFVKVNVNTRK